MSKALFLQLVHPSMMITLCFSCFEKNLQQQIIGKMVEIPGWTLVNVLWFDVMSIYMNCEKHRVMVSWFYLNLYRYFFAPKHAEKTSSKKYVPKLFPLKIQWAIYYRSRNFWTEWLMKKIFGIDYLNKLYQFKRKYHFKYEGSPL